MRSPDCHPNRVYYSTGMCKPCYSRGFILIRRKRAISLLGGKCVVCGMDDMRILEIDHVVEGSGETSMETIKRVLGGDIMGLQVLCPNCHSKKTYSFRFEVSGGQ